jgi:Carbohydrate/starch-binding module (family 21)
MLPRSTSSSAYLTMHRRSPSASKASSNTSSTEPSSLTNGEVAGNASRESGKLDPHGSIRQSPSPVNNPLMPTGAVLSPPESLQNSSDDEESSRGRGRELENLAELQAAIRIIEQRKEGSPNGAHDEELKNARKALNLVVPGSDSSLQNNDASSDSQRPPLSKEARKISHSRSSTDSNILLEVTHQTQSPMQYSRPESDEDDEDSDETGNQSKPPMVRKKSGELVRPALRPASSKRRPSSMPGTPTYSKAVHFDSHLEHVRHFLQVDKPLAVSAGSSPVENYESEIEFPFGNEDTGRSRGPSYEWEIRLSNFPADTEERKHQPVRVERVYLSSDNKNLIGAVAVQNLAFHKLVIARFTFDYWKMTSEVVADFNNDVRRKQINDGCDRFNFTIKLTDQAHLENKTMFFCIRYDVNGQQFWDNNGSINYQVEFSKKPKVQHGRNGMPGLGARPLNALPRSRPPPPMSAGSGRPRNLPNSFDDFATGLDSYPPYKQSPTAMIGDSPIRLKGPRSRAELVPDAPTRRPKSEGKAFGSRYDFGASLSAAIQNASAILGDQSGLTKKPDTKQSSHEVPASPTKPTPTAQQKPPSITVKQSSPRKSAPAATKTTPQKPAALLSDKPSLQSQSYQELVDKYCFVGSRQKSATEA